MMSKCQQHFYYYYYYYQLLLLLGAPTYLVQLRSQPALLFQRETALPLRLFQLTYHAIIISYRVCG